MKIPSEAEKCISKTKPYYVRPVNTYDIPPDTQTRATQGRSLILKSFAMKP